MADQLFLSLWYPDFRSAALAPALLGVLRQFALIGSVTGDTPLIRAVTVYPLAWSETPVYTRIYDIDKPGLGDIETEQAQPHVAVPAAMEPQHDDFAYEFEAEWLLWQPQLQGGLDPVWRRAPARFSVVGLGPEFDEQAYETNGQIRIGFGIDTPFLQEEVDLDAQASAHVRENVAQLVLLVHSIEKNCGISTRLLWSESGESLAEKLIARLQQVN
ncbi:hypothetical protein [Acidipila sp. EB88]|uniref:hypothetical protein n=1 Tax=Acidipila sp. EB88 TaxID=2305226 RepID=UPI000F5F59A5|nr:hypothetical protein [Acidipila sp. EB88]RRA49210.1 hypothetical protein D1Y84_13950 [Acidipila sp. EB88]